MTLRFIYEQRFDKNHKEYWVKISAKTNKVVQRVSKPQKIKVFRKRQQSQKYRKEQKAIDDEIVAITKKYNGNYATIKKRYLRQLKREQKAEKDRVKTEKAKGGKPRGRKKSSLKKDALKYASKRAGYQTIYRFWWVVKVGRDTPEIWAQQADSTEGNQFETVKDYVDEISKPIISEVKGIKNAVFVSGSGACVRLIDRDSKVTIRQYGLGSGCVRN